MGMLSEPDVSHKASTWILPSLTKTLVILLSSRVTVVPITQEYFCLRK